MVVVIDSEGTNDGRCMQQRQDDTCIQNIVRWNCTSITKCKGTMIEDLAQN